VLRCKARTRYSRVYTVRRYAGTGIVDGLMRVVDEWEPNAPADASFTDLH